MSCVSAALRSLIVDNDSVVEFPTTSGGSVGMYGNVKGSTAVAGTDDSCLPQRSATLVECNRC